MNATERRFLPVNVADAVDALYEALVARDWHETDAAEAALKAIPAFIKVLIS